MAVADGCGLLAFKDMGLVSREVGAREELPDPNPARGRPGPTPSAATQPSTLPLPNP
jgi:hypothetical protein